MLFCNLPQVLPNRLKIGHHLLQLLLPTWLRSFAFIVCFIWTTQLRFISTIVSFVISSSSQIYINLLQPGVAFLYPPENNRKPLCFLMFSGGIDKQHRTCNRLTHLSPMFHLYPPENVRRPRVFGYSSRLVTQKWLYSGQITKRSVLWRDRDKFTTVILSISYHEVNTWNLKGNCKGV